MSSKPRRFIKQEENDSQSAMLRLSLLALCLAVVVVSAYSLQNADQSGLSSLISSYVQGSLAHTHSVKPQRGNGKSRGKGGKGGNGWKGGKGKTFRGHGKADPDFSVIMQELWDLDINGLNSTTMRLALQGNTTIKSKEDMAPAKLFTFVDEEFLLSRPTIRSFIKLTDNYNPPVGVSETETQVEIAEIGEFLDAVCDTELMKAALVYLQQNEKPYPTMGSLRNFLKEAWFTLYPRSKNWTREIDSSGFEHVFLGESKGKQKEIGGMHNWIHAYFLEKDNGLDYTGYINTYTVIEPGRYVFGARLRAYNSYWKNPFSSFIFGSSPEFDLASYTICLIMRANKQCSFKIHDKPLSIKVLRYPASNFVDTAYPDIPGLF